MKSYHNIETRRTQGTDYYNGYSNIGVVRVSGQHGAWYVYMGQSAQTVQDGTNGVYVGGFKSLSDVSKAIDKLEVYDPSGVPTRCRVRVKH